MKKISLDHNGHKLVGAIARSGDTTWFSFGGEVWTQESEARGRRGKSASSALDPSVVTAPMPGKIVKVMVQAGATVDAGDVVIVMEAMKMEYTLKAAARGKVKAVQCQSGDQVTLGSAMVLLEVDA